ncbi:hypothetical protein ABID21_004652 [Pseudorhizobium tarimense]|uniref:Uncharacterized protein n=1 Tax=Pseudorhizobium tarimense TaxID=1079109 RepID=A0ABV2HD92_9HYPH
MAIAVALVVAVSAMTFVLKSEELSNTQCQELLREYRVGQRPFPEPDTQEYKRVWICIELVKQRQRGA